MRNLTINIFAIALILLGTTSCSDYLSQVPSDILTLEKTFESRESSMKYLASIYTYMPDEFAQRNSAAGNDSQGTSGAWMGGCDESEFVFDFTGSNTINNGSLTPETGFVKDYWEKYYRGIRTATIFMDNLDMCKTLSEGDYEQWTAEARAMRAVYYFYLFRLYGPVPILNEIISENASIDKLQIPRNTVEEVVEYIISELDEAIKTGLIKNIKTSGNAASREKGLGHIDQPMARAYKLQTRMLAASPLFTGENKFYASMANPDGTLLFPNYDATKKKQLWAEAAKEAKDFIADYVGNGYELTRINTADGKLDPYKSYREAIRGYKSEMTNFSGTTSAAEMIVFRERTGSGGMQYERTPKHHDARNEKGNGVSNDYKASSGVAATQEMVDSYFMANGKKPITGYQSDKMTPIINKESGYEEDYTGQPEYKEPSTGISLAPNGTPKAWIGREPRFYADITFDGQIWLNTAEGNVKTGMQFNGNSGRGMGNSNDYSKTGYIVRKSAPLGKWDTGDRICILLRLAQVYLDYAEALNEADFDVNKAEILKYVNLIRERAGIPGYGSGAVAGFKALPIPANQEEMRQAIRDERRVELAFESYRYFDVRRWGIAAEFENKPIHGMNIDENGSKFFVRTVSEGRVFENRDYLFPLPNKDININKSLVQNTGW